MENNIPKMFIVLMFLVLLPLTLFGVVFSLNLMGLEIPYTWKSLAGAYLLLTIIRIDRIEPVKAWNNRSW